MILRTLFVPFCLPPPSCTLDVEKSCTELSKYNKSKSQSLLIVRKDVHTKTYFLEAVQKSNLGYVERFMRFFGFYAFRLSSVKNIFERIVIEIQKTAQSSEKISLLNQTRLILNEKLFKKYHDHKPQHTIRPFSFYKLQNVPLRVGFTNIGASCYFASILQALFSSQAFMKWLKDKKNKAELGILVEKTFETMKQNTTLSFNTVKGLFSQYLQQGWLREKERSLHFQEQDSDLFLDFLLSNLLTQEDKQFLYIDQRGNERKWNSGWHVHIDIGKVQASTTFLQEFIDYGQPCPKKIDALPPPLMLFTITGRNQTTGPAKRTPFQAPRTLSIPYKDRTKTKESYTLSSVVMFQGEQQHGGHYYTYEPLYSDEGNIVAWMEYNDAVVLLHKEPRAIECIKQKISQKGYVFVYTQTASR